MRVVVASPTEDCVAHLVLDAEGVDHDVLFCEGEYGYGEHLTRLWKEGEGFVVVEHDVCPWMGAVWQLKECENDWCMYRYPKYGGALTRGLGCTKFSDRLVSTYPQLGVWSETSWRVLDGAVGGSIAKTLRGEDPDRHPLCTHVPSLAHARVTDG